MDDGTLIQFTLLPSRWGRRCNEVEAPLLLHCACVPSRCQTPIGRQHYAYVVHALDVISNNGLPVQRKREIMF